MGMSEVGGPATKNDSERDGGLDSRLKDGVVAIGVMD